MNASHLFRGVLAAAFLVPATLFAFSPDRTKAHGLTIIQTFEPRVRTDFNETLPSYGEVRMVINVDDTGKLVDWLPVSYSHERYLDAAVEAVKGWKYEPAIQSGERMGIRQQVVFNFQTRGQVTSFTGMEAANALFRTLVPASDIRRVYSGNQLDELPKPLKVVQPRWVPAVEKAAPGSGVLVDFYIDETGHIRMPTVSGYSDPTIAQAAVEAMDRWEFSVPTHNGRPVIVRATQWFSFAPASNKSG